MGANQTSYKSQNHFFKINLPTKYSFQNKLCLTYLINIVYDIVDDNIEIKSILLISVPNGDLFPVYGDGIISAGKTGYSGKGFRYVYRNEPRFKLLENNPYRIRIIYSNPNDSEFKNKIVGFKMFN